MPDAPTSLAARLERLVRGAHELGAEPSLSIVLQRVADLALEVVDARYAGIGLLAEDGRSLNVFVTAGMDQATARRIGDPPTGRGVLGTVIRRAHPLRIPDIQAHPDAVGFPPNHPPMRTFLGVPVQGEHGVIGNLYLTDKVDGLPFSEEDEDLCLLLAGVAAAAVQNAMHHEDSARLLEEVHSLLKSRKRFFAMVNHELRNALAGVYGWAEMLVRKKDPATLPRAAFEVLEASRSALTLIQDLLDVSVLDENRLQPRFQDVDCALLARKAITRVTPASQARRVSVLLQPPPAPVTCRTDGDRVQQILVNLLTNAIRHTPEGSTVTVAANAAGDHAVFTVTDEGPGIPDALLERIFDVYFTKPGEAGIGTGLGLPLSRRLARVLRGDLVAENRTEGGAVFTLSLPLQVTLASDGGVGHSSGLAQPGFPPINRVSAS